LRDSYLFLQAFTCLLRNALYFAIDVFPDCYEFRAEVFNLGNHTNFGMPNHAYTLIDASLYGKRGREDQPDFGRIFGAGDSHVAQMGLKVVF
jgi:hypothetical protein